VPPPAPNLSALLRRARWTCLGAALLIALGQTGALGALALAALSLADLEATPDVVFQVARLAFLSLAGIILARQFLLPLWRVLSDARLARFIERRAGAVPLDLVAAVQLDSVLRRPAEPSGPPVSPELAQAHVERMAGWLSGVRAGRLFEKRRLRWTGFAVLVASLALLAAVRFAPGSLPRAFERLLRPPVAAAPPGEPSAIGDIRLIYHYPAYAGRPDRLLEGTDGSIRVLPGTEVEIEADSDRVLRRAELRLSRVTLPLSVRGRHLSGRLTVLEAGGYRFALEDESGRDWIDDRLRAIQIEPDAPPRVELSRPAEDRTVRAEEGIDLGYDARDDFGLSRIRLVWRVAGRDGAGGEKTLRQLAGERGVRQQLRWELAGHGFRPGDRVQFYLEAEDNDTVRGPKSGRSVSRTLRIFSPEAQRREQSRQAQQIWEEMVSLLATALELDPKVRLLDVSAEEGLAALIGGLDKLVTHLSELAEKMRSDPGSPALTRALARVRSDLRRQLDRWQFSELRIPGDPDGAARRVPRLWRVGGGSLADFEPDRRNLARRLESAVLYLEDLLERQRIQDLERLAEELDATRERLQRLLEEYRRAPSDEARRRIEAEIARLREQLEALRARQSEMLAELRDEYLNPEALRQALERADMGGSLERLERMLAEGRIEEAMAELQRLARQSQEYRAQVGQALARFGDRRYRELAAAIARLRGEIAGLAEAQRRLLESTGRLRQRQLRALAPRSSADLRQAIEPMRRLLRSLRQNLERMPQEDLGHFAAEDLGGARRQAELLDPLLQAGDVARSLEVSRELSQSIERLRESLAADRAAARRFSPPEARRIEAQLELAAGAGRLARQIEEALRRLLPDAPAALSREEIRALESMAREQRDLAQRLRRAQAEFERVNQQAPLFGRDMLDGARRAGQRMDGAASELSRKNPQAAYPLEQSALSELEKLQHGMDSSCKRGSSGGGQGMPLPMGAEGDGEDGEGRDEGGPGGRMSREEVEVPRPEDFEPPDRFRRELLDGMKDPVPPEFEPQVRRYYQEIVR